MATTQTAVWPTLVAVGAGQGAVGVWGSSALPAAQPWTPVLDPNHPRLSLGFLPTAPWEGATVLTRRTSPGRQPRPTCLALPPGPGRPGGWSSAGVSGGAAEEGRQGLGT